jgi:hypothetical protein
VPSKPAALTAFLMLAVLPLGVGARNPAHGWNPPELEQRCISGTVSHLTVTFSSDRMLSAARVIVSKRIRNFVTASPSEFPIISTNKQVSVTLTFTIPQNLQERELLGAVRIVTKAEYRDNDDEDSIENYGGAIRSDFTRLRILMRIRRPNATEIPPTLTLPSPDRIASEGAGGLEYANDEVDVFLAPGASPTIVREVAARNWRTVSWAPTRILACIKYKFR